MAGVRLATVEEDAAGDLPRVLAARQHVQERRRGRATHAAVGWGVVHNLWGMFWRGEL